MPPYDFKYVEFDKNALKNALNPLDGSTEVIRGLVLSLGTIDSSGVYTLKANLTGWSNESRDLIDLGKPEMTCLRAYDGGYQKKSYFRGRTDRMQDYVDDEELLPDFEKVYFTKEQLIGVIDRMPDDQVKIVFLRAKTNYGLEGRMFKTLIALPTNLLPFYNIFESQQTIDVLNYEIGRSCQPGWRIEGIREHYNLKKNIFNITSENIRTRVRQMKKAIRSIFQISKRS